MIKPTIYNPATEYELTTIFGRAYVSFSNLPELQSHYNQIVAEKEKVKLRMKEFLASSRRDQNYRFQLSKLELDLLVIDTSLNPLDDPNFNLDAIYYGQEELRYLAFLRKAFNNKDLPESVRKYALTKMTPLQLEELLTFTNEFYLSLDVRTVENLLKLTSRRRLASGNVIDLFERIEKESKLRVKESPYTLSLRNNKELKDA